MSGDGGGCSRTCAACGAPETRIIYGTPFCRAHVPADVGVARRVTADEGRSLKLQRPPSPTPEEMARAVLALPGAFSAAQLAAAYRAAARRWHPDAAGGEPQAFRAITAAREILTPLAQG